MTFATGHSTHHVVILGGGFGGLYAAQALGRAPVSVMLVDRRNFHLFQPLLYQVATGGLSPGDIASPLRAVLSHQKNTRVLAAEVTDLDVARHRVLLRDGAITYDTLIVATGASHHYFGHEEWAAMAPGLKTIEDALAIRRRILLAFEAAEREADQEQRRTWLTFAIVGAGPTGVELAGALAELARKTLKNDFRAINPTETKIFLLEATDHVLSSYSPDLSAKAAASLSRLGVVIHTNTRVTDIQPHTVAMQHGEGAVEHMQAGTVLWAAGMKASPLGQVLANQAGAQLDRAGRIMVAPDLTVPGHPDIFIIGDLANFSHQTGQPLPGVAPVARQQGRYAAKLIQQRLKGNTLPPFRYKDKGTLAVIGRNAAVADLGALKFGGFPAWLIWVFIHIFYLIEFDNRIMVMFQWAWNYFTRKRGARLITGQDPFPLVAQTPSDALPAREHHDASN
jgi:NADH dehydrogenase